MLPELLAAPDAPPRTPLELGTGAGSLAYNLKGKLELTLTDRSARMLDVWDVRDNPPEGNLMTRTADEPRKDPGC